MMKKLVSIAVIVSLASVVYAGVNFDQDLNTKQIINAPYDPGYTPIPASARDFNRYTRDCRRYTFSSSENEITTERIWLTSQEYVQQCYTTYVPGPNGQQIPQQNCYERPGMTYNRYAQINLKPRKLYPWERETFEVCLEGPWMDLNIIEAGYKYSVQTVGNYDTLYVLTPQHKIAMDPDLSGLEMTDFSYNKDTKKFTFKVSDKWANEYAGEKVSIKIELKKSISGWFDSSLGEKEFTFDISPNYEMVFSEEDLVKPQSNDEVNKDVKLFNDKGRYLNWGFKRLGTISKDTYMKKGETPVIPVK